MFSYNYIQAFLYDMSTYVIKNTNVVDLVGWMLKITFDKALTKTARAWSNSWYNGLFDNTLMLLLCIEY